MSDTDDRPSWLERISQALFVGEPKDKEALIELLRDAQQRSVLDQDTLGMIEASLVLSEKKVRDIMVPRSKMKVVELSDPADVFIPMIIHTGHSRFPVVGDDKDDIIGILLAKDLLNYTFGEDRAFNLKEILRPANFVPESKRLNVLLKEFRAKHYHMAVVVDEYGGVSGLVTIEDVLEEIVGEIEDEFDTESEVNIQMQSPKSFLVNALTPIEEFNTYFNCEMSDDAYDTIGGLVTHTFGHVPKRGESTQIDHFEFKVTHADIRRIKMLKVIKN